MSATVHRSFRFRTDDWAQIVHDARQHRLNLTEYVASKLLDRIGSVGLDGRVDQLESRVERLERMADLGYN